MAGYAVAALNQTTEKRFQIVEQWKLVIYFSIEDEDCDTAPMKTVFLPLKMKTSVPMVKKWKQLQH